MGIGGGYSHIIAQHPEEEWRLTSDGRSVE